MPSDKQTIEFIPPLALWKNNDSRVQNISNITRWSFICPELFCVYDGGAFINNVNPEPMLS